MIRKRLVGVVTVKDGWAVQSIGYRRYLPLGRPEILVENLDRWGADEILLQVIDRTRRALGPDMELLERIGGLGLSTPLIYAGGIGSAADAVAAVAAAADRIVVDALIHDNPDEVVKAGELLGNQAMIASLPLSIEHGVAQLLDYRARASEPLKEPLLEMLRSGALSEALVIDWKHEGGPSSFDEALLTALPEGVPVIAFGGLSSPAQMGNILACQHVVAGAVGNFLSYREHAIQHYKTELFGVPMRSPTYQQTHRL
ncbi:MAG: HisA/HisF-related TIM barrel protein [Sphingomonas sp.]|uniref:HisA/HisF-related TIM barrel protein n=1 Tax=Sphingomonas sp. TaxID=28214 RepID=UPI00227247D1|nr:HisA/HisF-related TIM barrel protein [Sphingomonas sp.]MCX8477975.1 HisA/HisF-related TIM barrel protein [Sphingomonas sp.]